MIFDRLSVILSVFGRNKASAGDVARRWRLAFNADPELPCDLIRLSGLLTRQPVQMAEGFPQVAPINPYNLAYEAGALDMARLLLAQGGISYEDLNQLMEAKEL